MLWAVSLLHNFIISDGIKLSHFVITAQSGWLINFDVRKIELRESENSLTYQNANDCCHSWDSWEALKKEKREGKSKGEEEEKENFTARYYYDSIDIHDGSWLSPIENSWAINGPEGGNWFFSSTWAGQIKYWRTVRKLLQSWIGKRFFFTRFLRFPCKLYWGLTRIILTLAFKVFPCIWRKFLWFCQSSIWKLGTNLCVASFNDIPRLSPFKSCMFKDNSRFCFAWHFQEVNESPSKKSFICREIFHPSLSEMSLALVFPRLKW